jgi:hypothetical protein
MNYLPPRQTSPFIRGVAVFACVLGITVFYWALIPPATPVGIGGIALCVWGLQSSLERPFTAAQVVALLFGILCADIAIFVFLGLGVFRAH